MPSWTASTAQTASTTRTIRSRTARLPRLGHGRPALAHARVTRRPAGGLAELAVADAPGPCRHLRRRAGGETGHPRRQDIEFPKAKGGAEDVHVLAARHGLVLDRVVDTGGAIESGPRRARHHLRGER